MYIILYEHFEIKIGVNKQREFNVSIIAFIFILNTMFFQHWAYMNLIYSPSVDL